MTSLSIFISLAIPTMLLYSRKKSWYTKGLKSFLIILLTLIGIIGFFYSENNESRLLSYSIFAIPIFLIVDTFFKYLSLKIHNRDFYLWLRRSEEIDDSSLSMQKNKHIMASDMIFSLSLIILIVGLGLCGAILFGRNGLYN